MGGSVFISYRREADSGFAGRLYDRLEHSFGSERVFIDIDSIAPGEDFVAVLESRVAACDVFLALIGRDWLNVTNAAGRRRLDNPDDFVRIEIAAALAQGKRVIPVVVDDVAMPRKEELPEEIKPLARRQAIRIRHDRFRDDAERLVRALEKALAEAAGQAEAGGRTKEEEEKRQRAERERQRAEAGAKRQAEEQDRRRTEEAKRQSSEEKSSPSGTRWIIGAAIALAIVLGAIFVWSSLERTQIPSVTAEQKAVTPGPASDIEKAPSRAPSVTAEEKAVTPSPASDAEKAPDEASPRTFRDCEVCPEMVALPGGTFLMGSPAGEEGRYDDEGPQHEVTIRPFAIGKYEVTFEEWNACVAAGGCNGYRPDDRGWGRGRHPVINVSWDDAQAYCEWLAKETGKPYRLPSEAEWEYAARAGTTTRYVFGDEITEEDANFDGNVGRTTGVGAYPANPWGLYDMHGNVWEWVADHWHNNYKRAPVDGRAWIDATAGAGADRVIRGGSWIARARGVRSAHRGRRGPGSRIDYLGFRCARVQP